MKHPFLKFASVFFIAVITVFTSCTNAPKKKGISAAGPTFSLDYAKAFIAASNKMNGETFASGDSVKLVKC